MREVFEESQIQRSLKVVSEGSGASLKGKKRGTRRRRRMRNEREEEEEEGLVHFCARYAPMVRLAAPSAATPKTVLMEGQEQLKTESLCLSYSSTKASWERETGRERQTVNWAGWKNMCFPMCVFLHQLVIRWVELRKKNTG